MKTRLVPSAWLESEGRRLDCGPYLSGAIEARLLIDKLLVKKPKLSEVTLNGMGGVFHAGRESRRYVDDPRCGHPFLTSTDILMADLSQVARISKKQVAATPKFIVRSGWTLITRSGTIGRMAFARPDMDGMACSEDVLRVVPDSRLILPGYLYAYLSGQFGVPLVVADEYGSVQRHIEPDHLKNILIPRLPDNIERDAHDAVAEAARLRVEATQLLESAQDALREELGPPPTADHSLRLGSAVSSTVLSSASRLEAFFHNPLARVLDQWIGRLSNGYVHLQELAKVFDVPQFKHIYVDAAFGVAFFTSGDLFGLDRKPDKHLSVRATRDFEKYILQRGWILLARSGQLGGIIGRPQYADSALAGCAASDHVIRIVPRPRSATAGFLYTYLAMPELGYPLLVRTATGASIPALWPKYLDRIRVPRIPEALNERLDTIVTNAFEKRVQATTREDEARRLVENAIASLGGGA